MTVKLTTVVLIYKIITIGPFTASASTLIIPFWFFLGDIVAEVYGYPTAKRIIWMALFCQFVFAFTCGYLTTFTSPPSWPHQEVYNNLLGKLPRVALSSFLAIFLGALINIYIVSKFKILLRGKYFWLRSLGASAIGELVFTAVSYFNEFFGVTSASNIIKLIIASYAIKLIMNPVLVVPAVLSASFLKKAEGVDIYDYEMSK